MLRPAVKEECGAPGGGRGGPGRSGAATACQCRRPGGLAEGSWTDVRVTHAEAPADAEGAGLSGPASVPRATDGRGPWTGGEGSAIGAAGVEDGGGRGGCVRPTLVTVR